MVNSYIMHIKMVLLKFSAFVGSDNNDQCKSIFEASSDINNVNFESEYFQVYVIGINKDIHVWKIKRDEKGKEDIFEKISIIHLVYVLLMIKVKNYVCWIWWWNY